MYNIVIVCGGSGSAELQKGLYRVFGEDRFKLDVVINAYDNGKSTGECRRVFDNRILGPSDLRKNHLTRFQIKYAGELEDPESRQSRLFRMFNARVSGTDYRDYYYRAKHFLESAECEEWKKRELSLLLDYFFFDGDDIRESVKNVNFNDFSVSNIFYAACAAKHNYSLRAAGHVMAEILEIEDSVHLISDTSLLLGAVTENGRELDDEGDIVTWNNADDRINSIFLKDRTGAVHIPSVDEDLDEEYKVSELFRAADIIIFSSGTQWSSLIPTYIHKGFRELISSCSARKYLVMNNIEDGDMYGVSSADICDVVSGYIDLSDVSVVINNDAVDSMRQELPGIRYIHGHLGSDRPKYHDPEKLVRCIFEDYFSAALARSTVIFDFDGTVWNMRGDKSELKVGAENIDMLFGTILSGNSYEHLRSTLGEHYRGSALTVYCDYGNTFFKTDNPDEVGYLSDEYFIEHDLLSDLQKLREYRGKITLRGNVIITVKPLKNREKELAKINAVLEKYGGRYKAYIAGNTSIDISCSGYDKAVILKMIIEKETLDFNDIIYVGNEIYRGSEVCIADMGIATLNVDDVYECNCFLRIKERYIQQ